MTPANLKFCPRCGSIGYQYRERKYWYCPVCLFTYFHNVATSASVIAEVDGSVLMIERSNNPGKGMLSLPGGFVDPGERAEDAAVRECREETGLEAKDLFFVGSWPNEYVYKNVTYKTCDLYFGARVPGKPDERNLDMNEAVAYRLVRPEDVSGAPIAFESHRHAIMAWLERKRQQ